MNKKKMKKNHQRNWNSYTEFKAPNEFDEPLFFNQFEGLCLNPPMMGHPQGLMLNPGQNMWQYDDGNQNTMNHAGYQNTTNQAGYQNMQEFQSMQNMQNLQNIQNNMQNLQNLQNLQNMQNLQNIQNQGGVYQLFAGNQGGYQNQAARPREEKKNEGRGDNSKSLQEALVNALGIQQPQQQQPNNQNVFSGQRNTNSDLRNNYSNQQGFGMSNQAAGSFQKNFQNQNYQDMMAMQSMLLMQNMQNQGNRNNNPNFAGAAFQNFQNPNQRQGFQNSEEFQAFQNLQNLMSLQYNPNMQNFQSMPNFQNLQNFQNFQTPQNFQPQPQNFQSFPLPNPSYNPLAYQNIPQNQNYGFMPQNPSNTFADPNNENNNFLAFGSRNMSQAQNLGFLPPHPTNNPTNFPDNTTDNNVLSFGNRNRAFQSTSYQVPNTITEKEEEGITPNIEYMSQFPNLGQRPSQSRFYSNQQGTQEETPNQFFNQGLFFKSF